MRVDAEMDYGLCNYSSAVLGGFTKSNYAILNTFSNRAIACRCHKNESNYADA